jgi:hypothetical protein
MGFSDVDTARQLELAVAGTAQFPVRAVSVHVGVVAENNVASL